MKSNKSVTAQQSLDGPRRHRIYKSLLLLGFLKLPHQHNTSYKFKSYPSFGEDNPNLLERCPVFRWVNKKHARAVIKRKHICRYSPIFPS